MRRFKYTAVTIEGTISEGEMEAGSTRRAAADLGHRGLMLVSITELARARTSFSSSRPNARSITRFLAELALLLRSGLPLVEALDLCAVGTRANLGRIITSVRTQMLAGSSLVHALERHPHVFNQEIVAMARVADATGDLDGVFAAVAEQRERAHVLRDKVAGALRYPAFLLVSSAGILVFFLLAVIPQFQSLFSDSGQDPGVLVRFILAASNGLNENEGAIGLGLLGVLVTLLAVARSERARAVLLRACLAVPVVKGTWRLWRTSNFLSRLSVLLKQGVSPTDAIKVLHNPADAHLKSGTLLSVVDDVRRGGRLHDALKEAQFLPSVAIRMIQIGEESGELAKMTNEAATFYSQHLGRRLDLIAGFIGPIAILVVAGLIGGLMITIMSALISVDQAVN